MDFLGSVTRLIAAIPPGTPESLDACTLDPQKFSAMTDRWAKTLNSGDHWPIISLTTALSRAALAAIQIGVATSQVPIAFLEAGGLKNHQEAIESANHWVDVGLDGLSNLGRSLVAFFPWSGNLALYWYDSQKTS